MCDVEQTGGAGARERMWNCSWEGEVRREAGPLVTTADAVITLLVLALWAASIALFIHRSEPALLQPTDPAVGGARYGRSPTSPATTSCSGK